jgi:hypothetical protein
LDRQSLASCIDELDKLGQFGGDIDDLYAAPNSSIVPILKRVHNLGKVKGSSWTDIGPVGQREGRVAHFQRVPWDKTKQAGLRDLYNAAFVRATELAHSPAAYAAAKGIASGTMKGNPVRAASGIAEGVARSQTGGKVLKALQKKSKEGLRATREMLYPSPGMLVTASVKTAEPPPPEGVTAEQWDKILQRKAKSKEMATKLAYKLQGHTDVQGLRIAIENRKGSVRKGKDSDGNEWRTKMIPPYGYLVGTRAKDDEPVDVYVGPDKEAPDAFVVHQHNDDGKGFDEDKVMLGFRNKREAKEAYLKHYDDPKFLGPISRVSVQRLRELVRSKKKLVKITG